MKSNPRLLISAQTALDTTCSGVTTEITPPKAHAHFDVSNRHGTPLTEVVTEPGAQAEVGVGMHACGVKTPWAATVAAATAGLIGLMHKPNGGIFTCGFISATVPNGAVAPTNAAGTFNTDGDNPMEHWMADPAVTIAGIWQPSSRSRPIRTLPRLYRTLSLTHRRAQFPLQQ
jgi:hypothetical protein